MKSYAFGPTLTVALILLFSCENAGGVKKRTVEPEPPRYSIDADTNYRPNSTTKFTVKRTFYKVPKNRINPPLEVSNVVGTNAYVFAAIRLRENEVEGSFVLSLTERGSFQKLLNAMDSVAKYPNRDLLFEVESVIIYPSQAYEGFVAVDNYTDPLLRKAIREAYDFEDTKEISYYFNKSEIDSLKAAFNKYREEISNK